jgi:hypothetical protein
VVAVQMETSERELLDQWLAAWNDLVDFERTRPPNLSAAREYKRDVPRLIPTLRGLRREASRRASSS